jgi:hypothetical protein
MRDMLRTMLLAAAIGGAGAPAIAQQTGDGTVTTQTRERSSERSNLDWLGLLGLAGLLGLRRRDDHATTHTTTTHR